jgi:hypothetical protein
LQETFERLLATLAVDCAELDKNQDTLLNYFRVHYLDPERRLCISLLDLSTGGIAENEYDLLQHDSSILECCSHEVPNFEVDIPSVLTSTVDTKRLPMFLPLRCERTVVSDHKSRKNFRVVVIPRSFELANGCEYTLIGASFSMVNETNSFLYISCY